MADQFPPEATLEDAIGRLTFSVGLLVDAARAPVYLWGGIADLAPIWSTVGTAVAGVLIGTLLGERLLFGLSVRRFGQVVAGGVGLLGTWLLFGAT